MAYPTFHKGDVVSIDTSSRRSDDPGLSKYDSQLAIVTELTGKKRRARGSRITYGLYRVYIPKHNVYRTVKSRHLRLEKPIPGKRRYGEGESVEVLYELTPASEARVKSTFSGWKRPKDTRKRPKKITHPRLKVDWQEYGSRAARGENLGRLTLLGDE